jgi:hypothetical protein
MDEINRFSTSMMGHRDLNVVEEGKQVPEDIVESSQAQYPETSP